jgi:hypothetical protein
MVVSLPAENRLGYCELMYSLSSLSVSGVSRAIQRAGYQNTQSQKHPERDLEFFAFLLRDSGTRQEAREDAKSFDALRKQQKAQDVQATAGGAGKLEGRAFKDFPDSLSALGAACVRVGLLGADDGAVFLLRTFGLLRGLCTQLNVPVSYLDGMTDHARLGLMLSGSGAGGKRGPVRSMAKGALQERVQALLDGDVFEGACQVCVRAGGKVVVDSVAGSMGDCDPRPVSRCGGSCARVVAWLTCSAAAARDSLMCLLDLTKVLAALPVLRMVGRGVDLDSPLTGPKGAGPTLRLALCHARTGMEDAVPPSAFAHQLLEYDRWLSEVVRQAGEAESRGSKPDPVEAAYHTMSFGWELDLSLRNSVDPCTLYDVVQHSVPHELRQEVYFGQMPAEADERVCAVSHGYAAVAKAALFAAQGGDAGGGPGAVSLDLGRRALPGRAFVDPMMANTRAVRGALCEAPGRTHVPVVAADARIPSFNAYGSARATCDLAERQLRVLDKATQRQMQRVHTMESNALLGKLEWGLGFVLVRARNSGMLALVHHVAMGGVLVHIPEAHVTLVVLVSDLTVDRSLVRRVVELVLEEYDFEDLVSAAAM